MTDEAKAGVEAKAAARVSYDAEFEVEAEVTPEVSEALARLEAPETRSLGSLLGPSPRTIIQRIEVAFGQKIRAMEQEVAEMMEREVGLKQANRAAVENNHRLGAERDALAATVDPDGTMRLLRTGTCVTPLRPSFPGWSSSTKPSGSCNSCTNSTKSPLVALPLSGRMSTIGRRSAGNPSASFASTVSFPPS